MQKYILLMDCPNCRLTISEKEHDHHNRHAIELGLIEWADFQSENILGDCPHCNERLGYASDSDINTGDGSWDLESEILNN